MKILLNSDTIKKVTWAEEKETQSGIMDPQFYKAQDNILAKGSWTSGSDSWYPMEYGIAYYPRSTNSVTIIANSYRWFASEQLRDEEYQKMYGIEESKSKAFRIKNK